jgi:ArsR family transcriptional regulator
MQTNAALFQALSDPTRLRILLLLREMELAVGELAQVLAQSQPGMSKHVKVLLDCGLLKRRKEGNWVFLNLGASALVQPVFALLDRWAEVHGASPWIAADSARLAAIKSERADDAARYFAAHAAEWDKLRALHVPVAKVDEAILTALGDRKPGRLVDLGSGTGTVLRLFADKADHMIGIDRSPEMLRYARAMLAEEGIANAELRQGDINGLDLPAGSADTVILHQVLHYAQHPAAFIVEAARLLASDGRLLVVDLARHDREDLRKNHAHARLGFADEEVISWFRAAGLRGGAVDHLDGGALTVTIWSAQPDKKHLRVVS